MIRLKYYSELLGMKDTIAEEDMFLNETKTEIEKKLEQANKLNDLLQDRVASLESYMNQMMEKANTIQVEVEKKW